VHVLWLVVLWVALWGELSVGNVVGGLLVAVFVLVVSPLGIDDRSATWCRPLAALHFVGYFAFKLLQSNVQIAREVVRRDQRRRSGVLAVPMRGISPRLITLISNAYTLTPGSITIEVTQDPPMVYVHLLRLDDADATRRELLHLEYLAVRAFGSPEALAILRAEGVT
jgi:multicomponent Na+:H+ antiporter subunit E